MWMAHGPTSRVFNNADGTRSNIKSLLNIHPIIQPPKHPHTSTATHAKQDADPSHNYVRPSDSLSFQKNTIDTCSSLKSQTADEGFEKYARTYIPMQPIFCFRLPPNEVIDRQTIFSISFSFSCFLFEKL